MLYTQHQDTIELGKRIGSGGEGDVYEVVGKPDILAKIYHHAIDEVKLAKLNYMVASQTAELLQLTAWVLELLEDDQKRTVGFLMPRLREHLPIHDLYNTKSRKKHFPNADWRFLIHVSSNVARAFAVIHAHGHVIGDVNHTSIWVSRNGTVRLLDCDSFQIANPNAPDNPYKCEVGVPEFTPPELQGKPLDEVIRYAKHDHFGLAAIIFHLLFLGRHPYSGVYLGAGEMNVPRAINEGRFAFGKHALGREMQPPPFTLPLEATSPKLVQLFQQAFTTIDARPSAQEWMDALEGLSNNLKTCSNNPSHFIWQGSPTCNWCDLEAQSGTILFGSANLPALRSELEQLSLPSLISLNQTPLKPSNFAVQTREGLNRQTGQLTIAMGAIFVFLWITAFGVNAGLLLLFLIKPASNFIRNYYKKLSPDVQRIEDVYIQARALWYEQEQKHGSLLRANQDYADKRKALISIQEKLAVADQRRMQHLKLLQNTPSQASAQNAQLINHGYIKEKQLLERSYQSQINELRFLHAQLKDHVPMQVSALEIAQQRYLQAKADFDHIFAED